MVKGRFLPADDSRAARSFVVLGSKIQDELFRDVNPLGQLVRVAGERYRVIGVMESKGQMLGFDLDDAVYIPTVRAMSLFNQQSLMEIDLLYQKDLQSKTIAERAKKLLKTRHGAEDFTITTQEEMLKVLDSVLGILTMAVGGLGAISLLVGGVGVVTIMTIAVNERTPEIGLLRAIGADRTADSLAFSWGSGCPGRCWGSCRTSPWCRNCLAIRSLCSGLANSYSMDVCSICRGSGYWHWFFGRCPAGSSCCPA